MSPELRDKLALQAYFALVGLFWLLVYAAHWYIESKVGP